MLFIRALFLLIPGLFLFPDPGYGWGPGIHILHGSHILNGLNLLIPWLAKILADYPWDYLYGCISADIFIGKGQKLRDDHCHNWSVGQKMLLRAKKSNHQAFTFGYLSHLAADTIAHNFYIPNQLYLTPSTKRVGHLYWEVISDEYIEEKYWASAREVLERCNNHNDIFLQAIIPDKLIPFQTKKEIYVKMVKLYELSRWQRAVTQPNHNIGRGPSSHYIKYLSDLSIGLIINLLNHQEGALCLKYDPVGRDNLAAAKRLRRLAKKNGNKTLTENIFIIPPEIHELIDQVRRPDPTPQDSAGSPEPAKMRISMV